MQQLRVMPKQQPMRSAYFLLRGLEKVDGEFAFFCLGYNQERAKSLLGFDKLMKVMVGAWASFIRKQVCFIQPSMMRCERGYFNA
jgi:hypothetical protein